MAVNRPTNVKQKEADVNQKLQLYGIYSGKSNLVYVSNMTIAPLSLRYRTFGPFVVTSQHGMITNHELMVLNA